MSVPARPPLSPEERVVTQAFTVKWAFAWLEMHGYKPEECRDNAPNPVRGRCAIHLSRYDDLDLYETERYLRMKESRRDGGPVMPPHKEIERHAGKIIGVVEYDATEYDDRWQLSNPIWLKRFIPVRGHLGMWRLPPDVAAEVNRQLVEIEAEKAQAAESGKEA